MSFSTTPVRFNPDTILGPLKLAIFSLVFIYSNSHALGTEPPSLGCLNSPITWQTKKLNAKLHGVFSGKNISAKQGILTTHKESSTTLYLSSGYSSTNMSKISVDFDLLHKTGSDNGIRKQPLLSDIASSEGILAWTPYRSSRIILTNDNLNQLDRIELGADYLSLVGIDAVAPRTFAVLSRSKPEVAIIHVNLDNSTDITYVQLKNIAKGAYDIASNGKCFIVVYRGAGEIKQGSISELLTKKTIDLQPFANQLQNPQHAEFMDNKLYVIETNAEQIASFDINAAIKNTYQLPHSIFRGLSLINPKRVLLTGFVRQAYDKPMVKEDISESRTGLFDFRLEE